MTANSSDASRVDSSRGRGTVYDVFVSYRWVEPEKGWVRSHLVPALQAAGLKVCLDVEDFVPGRNLFLEMKRAGSKSRHLLCVVSPSYFEGASLAQVEALMGVGRDPLATRSTVIPFILISIEGPDVPSSDLLDLIRDRIPVSWIESAERPREWRKLLEVLEAPNRKAPPPPALGEKLPVPIPTPPRPVGSRSRILLTLAALALLGGSGYLAWRLGRPSKEREPNKFEAEATPGFRSTSDDASTDVVETPKSHPEPPQVAPTPDVASGGKERGWKLGQGSKGLDPPPGPEDSEPPVAPKEVKAFPYRENPEPGRIVLHISPEARLTLVLVPQNRLSKDYLFTPYYISKERLPVAALQLYFQTHSARTRFPEGAGPQQALESIYLEDLVGILNMLCVALPDGSQWINAQAAGIADVGDDWEIIQLSAKSESTDLPWLIRRNGPHAKDLLGVKVSLDAPRPPEAFLGFVRVVIPLEKVRAPCHPVREPLSMTPE